MMIRLFFITALILVVAWRPFPSDRFALDFAVCASAVLLTMTLAALHKTNIELHRLAQPCMPEHAPVVVRA